MGADFTDFNQDTRTICHQIFNVRYFSQSLSSFLPTPPVICFRPLILAKIIQAVASSWTRYKADSLTLTLEKQPGRPPELSRPSTAAVEAQVRVLLVLFLF